MKILFRQTIKPEWETEEELSSPSLSQDIEKTRLALEVAYAGFDNATDPDMIDCYIYEINSLLKRYQHLSRLCRKEGLSVTVSDQHSPIRALIGQIVG